MLNSKKIACAAIVMALLASTALNASAQSTVKTTTTTDAAGNTTWTSTEDKYWSTEYPSRPYYSKTVTYKNLEPAYRYGAESSTKYNGRPFEEVEKTLQTEWTNSRGDSTVTWEQARGAVKDSYTRTKEANGKTTETRSNTTTQPDGTVVKGTTTTTTTGGQ